MDIDDNNVASSSSNGAANKADVSIPVDRLLPAVRAYFDANCDADDVPDSDVLSLCEDFGHRVVALAQAMFGAFGIAFEYDHLLEATAAVSSSAAEEDLPLQASSAAVEDPRLRHPLCPPS